MDNNNTLLGTVLLCILFSIIGCKRDGRIGTMLAKYEELVTQAPDSILSVLDSLDKEETFKSKSDKMRFYLIKLRIQNNTDRPFMGTDTIENVSDYYSKKGSPRDRLYARYLLARAYLESQTYDKAYTAFQKCLADTVCTDDKEYNTLLSKVHIQFAKVYQARYMTDNEIEEMHKAIYMARKTGDEDLVINCRSRLFHPYIIKNDHDKVIGILNETCSIMRAKGQNRLAAQYQTALLSSYLKKEDYAHAKECIETFEKESGLFDGQGNIVKGKEIFYYKKGMYLLGTGKTDSAEYYFRKLLKCDYDLNNVEAAHKGLLSLYNKLGNSDSIYKYSTLYCATNDSSGIDIVKKTADEWTATMKDKGNETGLPMRHSSKTKGILLLLTVLFVALSATFYHTRRKKEAIHEETSADKEEGFVQEDVQETKNVERDATTDVHDNEFAGLIEFAHECASDCLTASENMTDLHWLKLESHMHEQFASFYEYVCRHKLSANEKHAVILTKLGFSTSEIQNLIDIRGNSFTNLKSRAGKKLFDSDSTRPFKKNVTELGEPFSG